MIPSLFQMRDPEMRAEYYERLREKREVKPLPETIPPSITPHHCENLEASRELECLNKYFPEEITTERLLKLKNMLDKLINGGGSGGGMRMQEPSVQSYDDGDGLNIDFKN